MFGDRGGKAMDKSTYYSRDAEMRAARENALTTLVLLAIGLAVGTALALLFAPNSGTKTRRELGHAIEDRLNSGRDAIEPSLKRLEKEFADLRKKVDERIGDLR